MRNKLKAFAIVLALIGLASVAVVAQNSAPLGSTPVQVTSAFYPLTPISATAAVNTQTVLTIPAPTQSGYYNYVCYLAYEIGNDATGGVTTNAVTTSTNFNTFAIKFSSLTTANLDSGVQVVLDSVAPGCAKSASPTTATTFTSTASLTHVAFTWYAAYFQAP